MKQFGFILITIILLVGCGNNTGHVPARDGKGEIDVVAYLPQKDMVKKYGGGFSGTVFIYHEATIDVSVTNNTIIENRHAKSVYRGYANYTDSSKKTVYTDMNITETYIEENQKPKINMYYRHVDIGEVQNELNKKDIFDYVDYSQHDLVIGISEITTYKQCKYGKENNDIDGKNGDFLTITCKIKKEETIHVDNEFLELDDEYTQKNGQKEIIQEYIKTYYYQKDIGYYGYHIQYLNEKSSTYSSEGLIEVTYK